MMARYHIHNFIQDLYERLRRFSYVCAPVIGIVIYFYLRHLSLIRIHDPIVFINNIVNISGVLSGFLFTAGSIFTALPSNRFIIALASSGYLVVINRTITLGIVMFFVSMLFGLFGMSDFIATITFVMGLSEAAISVYYLYKVTTLSSKSK